MRYKGVNDYELLYLVGENNEEVYFGYLEGQCVNQVYTTLELGLLGLIAISQFGRNEKADLAGRLAWKMLKAQ